MKDKGKKEKKAVKKYSRKEIIEIIAKVARVDKGAVTEDALILDDLGIDSLIAVEIIANIEKNFNMEIEDELLFEIKRVRDVVDIIERKVNK